MAPEDAKPGTTIDLSRRMDRMEQRQDTQEKTLNSLAQTVGRVELNQKHAEELGLLRHESLKTGLDTLTGTVGSFITRIEGIIDGTIQTAQTRQGAEVLAAYVAFRDKTIDRLDALEDKDILGTGKQAGVVFALSGGKAILLTAAALSSPIIAIVALVLGHK